MEQKHIKMIEDMHRIMVGDEEFDQEGIVKKVNRIDRKVDKHDVYFRVIITLFFVVAAVVGFWEKITNLLS